MRVMVSAPSGGDAGLNQGGTFYFMPAGQDDSEHGVSEYVARAVMGDPGMVKHFKCEPPLDEPAAPERARKLAASKPDKDVSKAEPSNS